MRAYSESAATRSAAGNKHVTDAASLALPRLGCPGYIRSRRSWGRPRWLTLRSTATLQIA